MQNRELSWLKFNVRVLEKGKLNAIPLYERMKFNAIFESNLTEFMMVRVGSLTDLLLLKKPQLDNKTGMTAKEQLDAIFKELIPLYDMRDQVYEKLERDFRAIGIANLKYHELNAEQKKWADAYFQEEIRPLMSPNVVYKMHPFPFMENNMLYIVAELERNEKPSYLLLPLGTNLPKVKLIPNTSNYIELSELVLNHLDDLLVNYQIKEKYVVRVTRNADINLEQSEDDEDEDYRKYVKKILKNRRRLAPVRIESNKPFSKDLEKFMLDNLELKRQQYFVTTAPLDMAYFWSLPALIGEDKFEALMFKPYKPRMTKMLDHSKALMQQVEHHDVFMAYPYESMNPFLNLLREAALDPRVFSIKITIYRLASNSQLVKYLLRAAEEGKEVTAIMELRARFDEENNIDYSEELIAGGVNVMYGIERYKVHSKVCLISYRDGGKTKYITHLATGNYNEYTAKLYQDMNIITAHYGIGKDASHFFNNLQTNNIDNSYQYLIQSPSTLRDTLLDLMDKEIDKGEAGYIRLKCNSVTDKGIIEKIAQASQAGVKVDMVIRGICALVPGIEGYTENVRVISIVGRFLEHARIYQFGREHGMQIYISSADLMTRNTQKRVEIGVPVLDSDIKKYIVDYLDNQFKDSFNAKEMKSDSNYYPVEGDFFDSQNYQIYHDPDYLARVFIEKEKNTPKAGVNSVFNKNRPEEQAGQSLKKEGLFKRIWRAIKGEY